MAVSVTTTFFNIISHSVSSALSFKDLLVIYYPAYTQFTVMKKPVNQPCTCVPDVLLPATVGGVRLNTVVKLQKPGVST